MKVLKSNSLNKLHTKPTYKVFCFWWSGKMGFQWSNGSDVEDWIGKNDAEIWYGFFSENIMNSVLKGWTFWFLFHMRIRFIELVKIKILKYSPLVSLGDHFDLKESLGRRKSNFQNRRYVSASLKNPDNLGAERSRDHEHTCSFADTHIISRRDKAVIVYVNQIPWS